MAMQTYNWTGFYAGVHGGYGFGEGSSIVLGGSVDIDGWFGGGQIGFNVQAPGTPWVFGLEVDSSFGKIEGAVTSFFPPVAQTITSRIDYAGTARTRFGYAHDRVLFYATGGIAWANAEVGVALSVPWGAVSFADRTMHVGFAAGAGVEWALADGWTMKAEYLYLDFSSETYFPDIAGGIDAAFDAHTVRVGLNYRFGGGKAPVAARY